MPVLVHDIDDEVLMVMVGPVDAALVVWLGLPLSLDVVLGLPAPLHQCPFAQVVRDPGLDEHLNRLPGPRLSGL